MLIKVTVTVDTSEDPQDEKETIDLMDRLSLEAHQALSEFGSVEEAEVQTLQSG